MCDRKNHNFKVITESKTELCSASKVVRWCKDCGAITVDRESDGRINPGYYMKIIGPHEIY